jgi:hypothetical protein
VLTRSYRGGRATRLRCAVLLLALCGTACCGPERRGRTTLEYLERVEARERERDGTAAQKSAAVLDLSGAPNTSEQAYFQQQATRQHAR